MGVLSSSTVALISKLNSTLSLNSPKLACGPGMKLEGRFQIYMNRLTEIPVTLKGFTVLQMHLLNRRLTMKMTQAEISLREDT